MSNKIKNKANISVVLGVLGFVAGIGLMFGDSWLIGIFGSIASAGVAYRGYMGAKG